MLSRVDMRLNGALAVSWLDEKDFAEVQAHEGHGEGLIDNMRSMAGVRVAALARERQRDGRTETKVSLRSTDGSVDVAALAHLRGGGGHVRAAGFTTEGTAAEVLAWVESNVAAML
jgi:phosphoesterase RecJ-like protein